MNDSMPRRPWIAGVLLIGIGLLLLGDQWLDLSGAVALGGLSLLFLALYVSTRSYGFLVPGMIFAGLAVGTGLQDAGYDENGAAVVIGLGLAFFGIYVANLFVARGPAHWWPLIPGSILTVVGSSLFFGGNDAVAEVWRFWPLALVIVGMIVLIAPRTPRRDLNTPH